MEFAANFSLFHSRISHRLIIREPIKSPASIEAGLGDKALAMTYSRMREAHYHRRGCVSLPSSGWDRVVPQRYVHQGEGGGSRFAGIRAFALIADDRAHALMGMGRNKVWRVSMCHRGFSYLRINARELEVI